MLLVGTDAGIATEVRRELQRHGHHLVWLRGTAVDTLREKPNVVLVVVPALESSQSALAKWLDAQSAMLSGIPTARLTAAVVASELVARATELLVKSAPPSAPRQKPPPPPPVKASGKHDARVFIDASGNLRPVGPAATRRLARRRGELDVLPAPETFVLMRRRDERRRVRLAGEITAPGSMCDVVTMIGHAHLGGELVVVDDNAARSLFFEPDHVVSAESSAHGERLGEIFYRQGVLRREQVDEASALATKRSIRFGEAVVELGWMTRERLFSLMSRQLDAIFHAILTTEVGWFYFFDEFDEARLSFRHRQPIPPLLLHTLQQMDEMRYFRAKIPTSAHVPQRIPDAAAAPREGASRVLEHVDGNRSVRELCRELGESELDVTRALFELVQLGLVAIQPPRESSAHVIVAAFNRAMRLLMRELDALDEGDTVRRELGRFARNHGLYASLFRSAFPADDGTLDPVSLSANASSMSEQPDRLLADSLYEYASYALFLARPHLVRAEGSTKSTEPKKTRLSGTFRELLAPLSPDERAEVPPSTRKPD